MARPARDKRTKLRPKDEPVDAIPPNLRGFMARNGGTASRVTIHRESETKIGRWDYVDEIQKSDLDEAFIKRTYGPGSYKITLMRADGTIADNIKFSIYGLAGSTAPAAPTPGAMSDNVMVAMMNSQASLMAAVITALAGKNQGPDVAALITAMKPANSPIQDLATLHALTKGTDNGNGAGFALLEKAMELGLVKSNVAGDDNGGTFLGLVREIMPELKTAIKNAQVERPALPNPQRRRANMRPWIAAIYEVRHFLPTFVKTSDPATTAARLLDLATPAQRADFERALAEHGNDLSPMYAEMMAALGPGAERHGKYLVDTMNALGLMIANAPTTPPAPPAKRKRTTGAKS